MPGEAVAFPSEGGVGILSTQRDQFVHRLVHLDVVLTRGTVQTKPIVYVTEKTLDIGENSAITQNGAVRRSMYCRFGKNACGALGPPGA